MKSLPKVSRNRQLRWKSSSLLWTNCFGVEEATATLKAGAVMRYRVEYRDLARTLEIEFEAAFPHRILGWTERLSRRPDARLTTRATRKATLMSDYWNRNGNVDRGLRDQLGLP